MLVVMITITNGFNIMGTVMSRVDMMNKDSGAIWTSFSASSLLFSTLAHHSELELKY
jgi:hypothetical protein